MKKQSLWLAVFASVLMSGSLSVWAEDAKKSIPQDERTFVDTVGKMKRAEIIALLGNPDKAEDIKLKDSGRVVASIWHYHNLNVDAKGAFYPTTELDIIGDQVSVVVFLNNDGSDANEGQSYEIKTNPSSI